MHQANKNRKQSKKFHLHKSVCLHWVFFFCKTFSMVLFLWQYFLISDYFMNMNYISFSFVSIGWDWTSNDWFVIDVVIITFSSHQRWNIIRIFCLNSPPLPLTSLYISLALYAFLLYLRFIGFHEINIFAMLCIIHGI